MLEPERKHERAQRAQGEIVAKLLRLLECDGKSEMSADALEVMALQLQLSSIHLKTCARELREAESERQFLAKEMGRKWLRFEPESVESEKLFMEGGASA